MLRLGCNWSQDLLLRKMIILTRLRKALINLVKFIEFLSVGERDFVEISIWTLKTLVESYILKKKVQDLNP